MLVTIITIVYEVPYSYYLKREEGNGERPLVHRADHLKAQVDYCEVVALHPSLSVPLEPSQVNETEGGSGAEKEAARPSQIALLEDAHAHPNLVGCRIILGQSVSRTRDQVEQLGHRVQEIEDLS